jgi:hypothetical protein
MGEEEMARAARHRADADRHQPGGARRRPADRRDVAPRHQSEFAGGLRIDAATIEIAEMVLAG